MVVTALPDLAGAVNARLRLSSTIAALAGTNISTVRQPSWNLPAYAVEIRPGKGGGEDDTPPLLWERFDLICYGPNPLSAHHLWRTVHYYFCPPVGSGRPSGFIAASTSVLKVAHEGGPIRLVDPDENWPYTFGSYRLTYNPDPVS